MNSIAPKIVVADSPANLAPTVATALAARALGAIADHGNFTLALSGGSTPQELYRYLAREAGAVALPWPQTDIFLVDERKVAYDHAASNYRAVRQLLLQQLTATPRSVQPLPITGGRNELAAYAIEMRRLTGTANNEIPQLDLVLLGMGVDGHTASLFPDAAVLAEQQELVIAYAVDATHGERITMSLPLLSNAREIFFLVTGAEKAETVARVLRQPFDPDGVPAQRLQPRGPVTWFLDRAAASKLDRDKILLTSTTEV